METMYDRIVKTCKARGITPSSMCVKLGIRKAIMSDLKSGKTLTIRTDTVVLFADFLGVSTDYLLTGRELTLTEEESMLLRCWRHASIADKQNAAFALRDYGMTMPEEEHKASQAG
ncbi:MAG: helix-turn-helix transcriptional regulator [Bacteroidales bacterium]|nr:helix-turn-helix transcriptional regulator [Bacteroidales bacterium]